MYGPSLFSCNKESLGGRFNSGPFGATRSKHHKPQSILIHFYEVQKLERPKNITQIEGQSSANILGLSQAAIFTS